jgi:hypothetical protein
VNALDPTAPAARPEALERQFGQAVARTLSVHSDALHPDLRERLRVARHRAMELARVRRLALVPVAQPVAVGADGGHFGWWGRLGTLLPAVALAGGLLAIQAWHEQTQIQTAVEVDAALLTDDVPLDAYADPGFIEFLKESNR